MKAFVYLFADKAAVPAGFEFWLRAYADPPIQTTRALLEYCPRIDWLLWVLDKAVAEGELPKTVLTHAKVIAAPYLKQAKDGRRSTAYPTFEGLKRVRPYLVTACQQESLA